MSASTRISKKLSDDQITEICRLLGLLSEPSRLVLLRALMDGPLTVTELMDVTGLKQGNVSKHLGLLQSARFVSRERDGNFARYKLADPRLVELCQLMCTRVKDDARQFAARLK
jgi:DNA-binding transcriptional ArsR family regulator